MREDSDAYGGGPPPEAHGRYVHAGRYRTLHERGRRLVDRLTAEFDVDRVDATGRELSATQWADAPAVRLIPQDSDAGPLTVVFHDLPGLIVRCGQWNVFRVPDCGCDGCDEDPQQLWEDLHEVVSALVGGRFHERLVAQPPNAWQVEYTIPNGASRAAAIQYVANRFGSGWFSACTGWAAMDPTQAGAPGTVRRAVWPPRGWLTEEGP